MEGEQKTKSDEVSVDINKLVQTLKTKTEMLGSLSSDCCIYRVSPRFRELNKKAYTPQVVSIGPFHHGKHELRVMEDHKRRYLVDFLKRCKINLEEYIGNIQKLEEPLRDSYAEITEHSREEFMEIMAVDGAFLLEYFLKGFSGDCSSNDRIWHRQRLANDVRFDILMIENQLPFFLLEFLFELLKKSQVYAGLSLKAIVAKGLMDATGWGWLKVNYIMNGDREVKHLVDFIGICLQPSSDVPLVMRRECESLTTPTISELHRAGVKFKPSSSKCLYDLKFNNGILEIPKITLADNDDIVMRNLQAFEQCHFPYKYMNDYTCIMDMLINNEEDVELLVQNGIIENWLQDNLAVAAMINDLGNGCIVTSDNFHFAGLSHDLTAYYKKPWNKRKATLKQKYFSNPWTVISVIAAAFLLLLAIIQTVMSTLQIV
ncbi:putative UPF0481 protein At3g02645 [Euphorbia lathyris]|uniref:putative UPF0481 protein At3g02645 n=1 Tax=Euphorbia lathyris TaxID=212925 RepID=UPI003313803C